jgi:hypothetical protein
MSRFTPEMDRNGIQWQEPTGTWKEEQDIVHLATIAEKLVVPQDHNNTDLLNSIPTPWSRLLLFENALYNPQHPSHRDILDQWRGLLGLLALAKPLGLNIQPSSEEYTINLSDFAGEHPIAKTFVDLRPHYKVNGADVETGKWERFHLIIVGGQLLGATSPRTLVFTAIDHRCPPEIPFTNKEGRLSDPLIYYKKFKDTKCLTLLKQWLDSFIQAADERNTDLVTLLGTFPAAPNVTAQKRHGKLLGLLNEWRNEVKREIPSGSASITLGRTEPFFTWPPYHSLLFLPGLPPSNESDLLLATEIASQKRVLVCYRPDRGQNPKKNSMLYNQHGQVIQAEDLRIGDGRWMKSDEKLPERIDFLPEGWEYISDPIAELFEDQLIEVNLPDADEGMDSTYSLKVNHKTFLYPFKKEVLKYFTPSELHQFTRIEVEADRGYRVILKLPLVKGRSIRATRRYEEAAQELVLNNNSAKDHLTSELAMWPSFADSNWKHYFYFKRQIAGEAARNLDFAPVNSEVARSSPDNKSHWYYATRPIDAFVGGVGHKNGLLLPKYEQLPPQAGVDYWKIAVDFGSTHTRVFYIQMQKEDDEKFRPLSDTIEQLDFSAYAKSLTTSDPDALKNDFFALSGKLDPPTRAELKTLLMQPINDPTSTQDWRPREGFSYMHWIQGGFDDRKLKTDIKWESSGNKNDLRSFLHCLMIMVQAEALRRNASIVFVERSYPSAFSQPLVADHNAEWVTLGASMGLKVQAEMDKILSEAIATARYLVSTGARTANNTISLDIGGSTTDIAIWYGSGEHRKATLGAQESVKMAAGMVGRYLQSDASAQTFLEWFVRTVKQQGVIEDLSLNSFKGKRNGYALMFYNTLTYYELGGTERKDKFTALMGLIKARDEARGLLVHLIYLFGSLIYYSGLLTRKVGLPEQHNYYVYFCGKGGTLITWIDNYTRFVEKMFLAGLNGPPPADASGQGASPKVEVPASNESQQEKAHGSANATGKNLPVKVEVRISQQPKQEVGRGLLVENSSKLNENDDDSFGLIDPKPPSVTAGETGYKIREGAATRELSWDEDLTGSVLRNLIGTLPTFEQMRELNCFISAVREAFKYQDEENPAFNFDNILTSERDKYLYVDSLTNRLLGDDEGCVLHDLKQENNPHALVEPLLITEMKVLLEHLSENEKLFR